MINDYVNEILPFLNCTDLSACACVCKGWLRIIELGNIEISKEINKLLSDKKIFFFGPNEWKKHFDSICSAPPLPRKICQLIRSQNPLPLARLEGTVGETHLLVLIPKFLKEKSLTIHALEQEFLKEDASYHTNSNSYKNHAYSGTKKTHWILMSLDFLNFDGNVCNYKIQKNKLKYFPEYQIPCALDAFTAISAYKKENTLTIKDLDIEFMTYCQETQGDDRLVVSDLSGYYPCTLLSLVKGEESSNVGISPMRIL